MRQERRKRGMARAYAFAGGRSMFMAYLILGLVTLLALIGKLSAEYVAALGIVQAVVTSRQVADDYTARKYANGNGS